MKVFRTGNAPLEFDGERIAHATSGNRDAARWHDLALYRTAGGKLVLEVVYRTRWQGEIEHFHGVVTDEASAADELQMFDPMRAVMGFPPGGQYEQKQARLEQTLRAGYESAVSELLESAGISERVE